MNQTPSFAPPDAPVLRTEALRKQYRLGAVEVTALDGVDFAVQRGEFVAIMGPSGSGKSTLLHLLGGLDRPTSGDVILAGERLAALADDALSLVRRRRIGFIFQAFNLIPTLTVEENVALPLVMDGRDAAQYATKLETLLQLVLLAERRHHKPDQLSGGQQQRVAIARALITEPEIVLADEPTGNLDSKSGTIVLDLLRRVCKGMPATIVMVTHDPRAASYADRVVFLKDGRLVDECRNRQDGRDLIRVAERLAALEE
ncbi:MAG: ABC transporter ATP-binding protein [Anaerolineales bacterium]|nr:ABC transporter ATP-binding protein [Anaerolineales bacterium]